VLNSWKSLNSRRQNGSSFELQQHHHRQEFSVSGLISG
jgi:hypothetical protein